MADKIIHGSQDIVLANSSIDVSALPASGVSAGNFHANNSQVFGITVDAKGRVTNAISNTDVKITGVSFGNAHANGDATSSFSHLPNQRIYVSSSAPANNSIGNNGDIWYQTLT